MSHPSFFDTAARITMYDPLAELLGAADKGLIEYSYTEVVKLAGHSCPTVAGAYLMTLRALKHLYGDGIAQRGDIKVEFRDDQLDGVTGVIANVVGLITGATVDNGFKGLAGKYDRRNLMSFNAPIEGEIRYQRLDTGAQATVSFNASVVPGSPGLMPALHRVLAGAATEEERGGFARDWQERVGSILENADHPELVTCA
ncbi:FmdE family protein [Pollutimonas bauzanensis]|uniref:Formylmethanofuran dehydrogenase subunit E n=1 Tax=Pollutimonas bauzanensis TaxID=658167 RepID=A0A1M5SRP3_9BURK|nr:FmdE family protein [Pollutimonas bauzanensis]SHH40998.1 Formylmethanofuran dehydrogenase subunit E [Pollutimonas bauzanensis]